MQYFTIYTSYNYKMGLFLQKKNNELRLTSYMEDTDGFLLFTIFVRMCMHSHLTLAGKNIHTQFDFAVQKREIMDVTYVPSICVTCMTCSEKFQKVIDIKILHKIEFILINYFPK